ncbi:UvrD-helicase domain-containing protein [Sphingobacterium sp. UBA6320]|jgi:DNA helicase-2/ATP-dependent DNA helicase PcrA|uniref:UvrD-helicase domain-containing protein n=1 Tax=Sphingobacterium sp. UBA6320 TaxID=1947510 RepID=UPI0025D5CEE8|nr:UvrD-helicase domain-containing protein [Sphingobacterium sp. UBA6320]
MPQEIEITDDQVRLAEKYLLPHGKSFDGERVAFIKDLSTHDLHAVPGSGKTTALLAKLIALEQHLPFSDRSGVLVISHTNAAVDEIKNKIGHICPRLFAYPNFIGTIQGFVDAFLAVPYYKSIYRRRPVRIDDEIYYESHYPDYKLNFVLSKRQDANKLLYGYRLREGDKLRLGLGDETFVFKETSDTYKKILAIKKGLRDSGLLCFDDAYILAQEYLIKFPGIINILRKRFSYVFIDEMQDMDKHQYDLLEALFGNTEDVTYQRIGDKNQAIFNSESEMLDIWQERNVKELNGSHRLHPATACIVESLALSPIAVVGNRTNPDGSEVDIKPVMLVYENDTASEVISCFADEIKRLVDEGKIDLTSDNVHKAVAWTAAKPGDKADMIKLNHYHNSFSKEHAKLKINYPCLEAYLHYHRKDAGKLASIRKSALNGILKILRLEEVVSPETGRTFTKRSLVDWIKEKQADFYRNFKLQLYQITVLNIEKKINEALEALVKLATEVLSKLGKTIKKSKTFVAEKYVPVVASAKEDPGQKSNCFVKNGIHIDVATVHAVKGQTHTSTLYMESFYQKNVGGKGQYESSRVADQLQGTPLAEGAHEYIRQSLKMTYVGFSRSTHLLGFAIHKSRFDALYSGKPNMDRWKVIMVPAANKVALAVSK